MAYRIHIDIPLDILSQEDAIKAATAILNEMVRLEVQDLVKSLGGNQINYRLGDDTDRQKSNYLVLTPSGHATNQKCKILLTDEQSSV
jgi:hypothetical protein